MPGANSSLTDRLRRISPFRWRLEWALLLIAATTSVLSEQARDAKGRDPYEIVSAGRAARATVLSTQIRIVPLPPRRGIPQQEEHTLVNLEWQDDQGARRRIESYRLDGVTASALKIDSAKGQWPPVVQILYLDRPVAAPARNPPSGGVAEQGVTASAFQRHCRPWQQCRVVVLAPDMLTPAEEAAANVDYVLERAPHALHLSLALLIVLLGLRFAGIVHNRPSLE